MWHTDVSNFVVSQRSVGWFHNNYKLYLRISHIAVSVITESGKCWKRNITKLQCYTFNRHFISHCIVLSSFPIGGVLTSNNIPGNRLETSSNRIIKFCHGIFVQNFYSINSYMLTSKCIKMLDFTQTVWERTAFPAELGMVGKGTKKGREWDGKG